MGQSVLSEIVCAIAEAEGTEPESLDVSLEEYVSTDAIRDLVNHKSDSWRLQFETSKHVVEVSGDRRIYIDGEQRQMSL